MVPRTVKTRPSSGKIVSVQGATDASTAQRAATRYVKNTFVVVLDDDNKTFKGKGVSGQQTVRSDWSPHATGDTELLEAPN